ncbi:hypothetical protein MVEN_02194900 [Mycena venus]|uniref:Uncharacterized protein n=1 Tax=Mycena venus TaxID=2733690 RepID=A0A8H6X7E8_9AGAR|nr:hypothetical protein MVEN_02194900 [Mycena venus]
MKLTIRLKFPREVIDSTPFHQLESFDIVIDTDTMDILGVVGVAAGSVAIPLSAVSTATSVAAISQGASAQQAGAQGGGGGADPKDDPRLAKFSLRVNCPDSRAVDGKIVVLRKQRLYLDDSDPAHRTFDDGHPFSGFYIEYPVGKKPLGLVSTISKEPPELNWIYADSQTLELKYGNKTASQNHIPGPWDWTDDQEALMLDGWESLVALEESPGVWVVHYDRDDDHLSRVQRGKSKPVVEISLERRILKQPAS